MLPGWAVECARRLVAIVLLATIPAAPAAAGPRVAFNLITQHGTSFTERDIQLLSANHQLKPDVGAAIARQWYDVENVDLIVDVPVSAVGLAVQEIARQRKRLLIVHSTGTTDFTGKACSPYGMQWVFNTYALAAGTAREVVKRGGDTWPSPRPRMHDLDRHRRTMDGFGRRT
jgi:branched-chain amino acid transport system substrate-binding protein